MFFVVFRVREYSHWIRLEILYIFPLQMPRELLRRSSLGLQLYLKHLLKVSQRLCRSRSVFFLKKSLSLQKSQPTSFPRILSSELSRNYLGIIPELSWNYSREGDRVPELKVPFRLHKTPLWGSELSRNYPGIILELSWNY